MMRDYLKRVPLCIIGLALCSFSMMISVKAGEVGTNAWNTLFLGISDRTGMTFGQAGLMINALVIAIDIIGRGRLGFGTLFNAIMIPCMSDLFLALFDFIPAAPNQIWGMAYTLFAQLLQSFAIIVYMKASLGCGPRDTLMVIVGKLMPKAPIGLAKLVLESGVLVVGVVLGAPFGLGSVAILLLQASMFQFACFVFRYEPRAAVHESFGDTICRFRKAIEAKKS